MPKVSLNKSYAGEHWTKRKKLKDDYHWIVKSQFKDVLSKDNRYEVDYTFIFKNNPLDAMNCAYSAKMIEDVIFEKDEWNIITKNSLSSKKGTEDLVIINILF